VRGLGTLINVSTVLVGSGVGLAVGKRIPQSMRTSVVHVIALVTIVIGVREVLTTHNVVFPLVGMAVGVVIGEALRIEEALRRLAEWVRAKVGADSEGGFAEGFVVATLLYCVGPLTILGGIEDGSGSFPQLYVIKAALDGTMAIVLTARYGAGVALSALSVLVVQGSLVVGGSALDALLDPRMSTEMFAAGGLAVLGIGLNLLEVTRIRLASFLPGLVVTPILVSTFAVG
jgi:uncharacterized membrane protein YqgA involved in biofilm formation